MAIYCSVGQTISIAIDRSQWECINLFTIALIWRQRAIPLYWCLLPKLGSSNLSEQTLALKQVLPLMKEYKVLVLGDSLPFGNPLRKFIITDLGSLPKAIAAYKQRMAIEEMFRDCKSGVYNIEGTGLRGELLVKIILLMAIAYLEAIAKRTEIQKQQVQK